MPGAGRQIPQATALARNKMPNKFLAAIVVIFSLSPAFANEPSSPNASVESLRQQGYSVGVVTPIYSQILALSSPKGFIPAFENTSGDRYILEFVPEGETVKKWSQMITISGMKGLAKIPNVTPIRIADGIAGGFKRTCPESFGGVIIGAMQISGFEAFGVVVGCGISVPAGEPYSESVLLIVVKGENDFYTVQWAERGTPSKTPIKYDLDKWAGRLKDLSPIKLCPIVPGEPAPYPSCASRK